MGCICYKLLLLYPCCFCRINCPLRQKAADAQKNDKTSQEYHYADSCQAVHRTDFIGCICKYHAFALSRIHAEKAQPILLQKTALGICFLHLINHLLLEACIGKCIIIPTRYRDFSCVIDFQNKIWKPDTAVVFFGNFRLDRIHGNLPHHIMALAFQTALCHLQYHCHHNEHHDCDDAHIDDNKLVVEPFNHG